MYCSLIKLNYFGSLEALWDHESQATLHLARETPSREADLTNEWSEIKGREHLESEQNKPCAVNVEKQSSKLWE